MQLEKYSETTVGTSSPANSKRYSGYISRHGFEIRSRDLPICDLIQYHRREISFEIRDSDITQLVTPLIPSICIEHNRYFNKPKRANLCIEGMHYKYLLDTETEIRVAPINAPQDSAQQTYDRIRAAGGQACGGYFVTVNGLGYHFFCALEELDSNRSKAKELRVWLIEQIKENYSALDRDKIIQFARDENKLLKELEINFKSNLIKLQQIGRENPELRGLEGEALERKGYELITAPIVAWFPQFRQRIESCGISNAESDLVDKIEAHFQQMRLEYQSSRDINIEISATINYSNALR